MFIFLSYLTTKAKVSDIVCNIYFSPFSRQILDYLTSASTCSSPMVNIRKRKIAFGRVSERFDHKGLHPNFEKRGCTHRYRLIGPGHYYREEKRKLKGIGYKLSQESEEWSKNLAYKAQFKLKERIWQTSILGPGWHDVKNDEHIKFGKMSRASRFPPSKKWTTPGPGIYGKNHIPHLRLEEKTRFKTFSTKPTFEFDSCMPRSINIERRYHLPPNLYNRKSFADEIISKFVSKRGPYDLFTGARDETSLYGHYAKSKETYKGRSANFQTLIERLNDGCNKHKGKFLTCGKETYPKIRLALTDPKLSMPDPEKPAPNHYNPKEPSKPSNVARFPFNSSVLHTRPLGKVALKPPPNRYETLKNKMIFGNGWKNVFLSKTKRGIPLPEKMSWF